jgi:hypothetical protein
LLSAIVFNLIFLLETVPINISGQTEQNKNIAAQGVIYQSISGSIIGKIVGSPTDVNMHLTLIVIFAGSLGGLIHGISRLASHTEKGDFKLGNFLVYLKTICRGCFISCSVFCI